MSEIVSSTEVIQSYVERITESLRESVEKILNTSQLLVESEDNLTEIEFVDLVSLLPISQSTISKLLLIGRNKYLPTKTNSLPPHWTTIYEISQLEETEFDDGVREGFINPSSTKRDIDLFRSRFTTNDDDTNDDDTNDDDTNVSTLGTIAIPSSFDLNKLDELMNEVRELESRYGVEFKSDKSKRGLIGIRRKKLSTNLTVELERRRSMYNKLDFNFDQIQTLEDTFNQLRGKLDYHKNSDGSFSYNDVRNPNHPYHGWTSTDLYRFCRENMILSRYTQMKEIDKEGYIKSLVKIHCEGDSGKRSDVKKKLQRLFVRGNEESKKWSEWGLKTIIEGDD